MGFKKGKDWNGNKKGRPIDPAIVEMRAALAEVEARKRKKLLTIFFEKAFISEKVLIAAAKKIAPDLQHTTGDIGLKIDILPPIIRRKDDRENNPA
jgi:hypothetical protein